MSWLPAQPTPNSNEGIRVVHGVQRETANRPVGDQTPESAPALDKSLDKFGGWHQ